MRLAALVSAAFGAVAAVPAAQAAVFARCHGSSGVLCASVPAPLDYSGATPGQISLTVEKLPAQGRERGVMLLVAGGPGQASAKVFDLAHSRSMWRSMFPGYTLVAYDDRGTGGSGPLSCAALDTLTSNPAEDEIAAVVAACGDALGPSRAFYGTRDHAEDLETVRAALGGVDRVALWGVSYGTRHVLAYALAHPDHVERLLLDSVAPLQDDPFAADVLRTIPLGLASLCRNGACRAATRHPVADVVKLAEQLEAKPVAVSVRGRVIGSLNGVAFLQLVVGADLSPGLAAELPATVSAALAGRMQPVKRLVLLGAADFSGGPAFNPVLQLTTTCLDGAFPWRPDTPVAERQAAIDAALAALPAGTTGPFGAWATKLGAAAICRTWPAPTDARPLAAGPLPDVPVLILAGDLDMRTPLAGARVVAAAFPHARLLVVPGVGHSVLTSDYSFCASRAVKAWLDGKQPAACRRARALLAPVPAFPASVASIAPASGASGLAGRTLAAVRVTLREAEAAWLASQGGRVPGVYGGSLTSRDRSLKLVGYSAVPGLALSGRLMLEEDKSGRSPLGTLSGSIWVTGPNAAHGMLFVLGGRLFGRLAGRTV